MSGARACSLYIVFIPCKKFPTTTSSAIWWGGDSKAIDENPRPGLLRAAAQPASRVRADCEASHPDSRPRGLKTRTVHTSNPVGGAESTFQLTGRCCTPHAVALATVRGSQDLEIRSGRDLRRFVVPCPKRSRNGAACPRRSRRCPIRSRAGDDLLGLPRLRPFRDQ